MDTDGIGNGYEAGAREPLLYASSICITESALLHSLSVSICVHLWLITSGVRRGLLDLDGGALLFELGLQGGGFVLIDAFLDRRRGAVDQVLGFLQAEGRHLADRLDHVDLLVAGGGEDHIEGGLLLLL